MLSLRLLQLSHQNHAHCMVIFNCYCFGGLAPKTKSLSEDKRPNPNRVPATFFSGPISYEKESGFGPCQVALDPWWTFGPQSLGPDIY